MASMEWLVQFHELMLSPLGVGISAELGHIDQERRGIALRPMAYTTSITNLSLGRKNSKGLHSLRLISLTTPGGDVGCITGT